MSRCVTLNQFCRPFAAFAPLGCILHWQTLAISEIELVGICGAGFCVWTVSGVVKTTPKLKRKTTSEKLHLAKCIFLLSRLVTIGDVATGSNRAGKNLTQNATKSPTHAYI